MDKGWSEEKKKEIYELEDEAFEILKDLKGGITKSQYKTVQKLVETLKDNDKNYVERIFFCKRLLEEPKYRNLDEIDKIKFIMKVATFDMSDLYYFNKDGNIECNP